MQGRVGRDVRAAAGRRAVVGHVARPTAAVLRCKCPPKSVWGTIRVSRRPVRSDSRSIAASRFFHRRHRPEPGRRRQEERLGQGPDSGHGRSCPGVLPPFEIDRARTPASVRQAPAGRANEHAAPRELNSLPRAAGTGTDSRLPRWRFTNDRRPRLLTLPSIVRPPLSRFTVFSLFPPSWSCPAARRPVPQ